MIKAAVLFFLLSLPNVSSTALQQCHCDSYTKCEDEIKDKITFGNCMKDCRYKYNRSGKIDSEYLDCLEEYEDVLTDTLVCSQTITGEGCTSHPTNVIQRRNFTVFKHYAEKDMEKAIKKIGMTLQYRKKAAERFNTCLLQCFFPGVNECTKQLDCGLYAVPEDRMVETISTCAVENGVTKEVVHGLAGCLKLVTRPKKLKKTHETAEENEFRRKY